MNFLTTFTMTVHEPVYHIPKGYSSLQVMLRAFRFSRSPITEVCGNMKKFGDTYSALFPGNLQLILTQDPGFINHVLRERHTNYQKSEMSAGRGAQLFGNGLVFSNGDYWLQQRRLIQPGFHAKRLQGLYEIISRTVDESLASFPVGDNIDIYPLMYRLSFRVAIRSLFDIPLSAETMTELSQAFTDVQNFLVDDIRQPFRRLLYPFNGEKKQALERSAAMKEMIRGIIRRRKADTASYDDLLNMLLTARYEDSGEGMTEDQLIDEVLVLMLAGHDTTANTLAWLLYLVANDEEVRQQLIGIAKAATDSQSCIRNDYFHAVIDEAMRLYPPAWIADREALTDDEYGHFSYPAGTVIMTFFYGLHRSSDYWEVAEEFHPGRFLDESGKIRKMNAFYPFGAGPRMCIGNNFAMAEMCLFLQAFFTRFTIAATDQVPELKPLLTLRPDKVLLHIRRQ
ncbi:cytochrome P450 [Puia dinghuensis]|uniref:Cytochrome P450 n=1 Tax=Puia dinghuensis TaxID=1792502 RepID=A0A8J2XVK5_9BACT|nr:cytochrome P450 [Puia dinghuensis]GGB12926.1 cytochrome P450 [Puia dinghuensis]